MAIAGFLRWTAFGVGLWAAVSMPAWGGRLQERGAVQEAKKDSLALAQTALEAGKVDEALGLFEQVRATAHEAQDPRVEAEALSGIGKVWSSRNEQKKAIEAFSAALDLRRAAAAETKAAADVDLEASVVGMLGDERSAMDDYKSALALYEEELALRRQSGNKQREAVALSRMAAEQSVLSRTDEAMHSHEQALAIFQGLKYKRGEAIELDEIGKLQDALSHFEAGIALHERALAIEREIKDRANEGNTLGALANDYSAMGDETKAAELLMESIQIARETKNSRYEAFVTDSLGNLYHRTGLYEKAIETLKAALELDRAAHARRDAAEILADIGMVYDSLNQPQRAVELTQEALATCKEVGDTNCLAVSEANMGQYLDHLGEFAKAAEADQRALALATSIHDPQGEATYLTNLGQAQEHLKQPAAAVASYTRALALSQEIKDRNLEGEALYRLGLARLKLGASKQGKALLQQALLVQRAVNKPQQQARTLGSLADWYEAMHRPELAVFFGKQAINTLQTIRASNGGLAVDLRQSYLTGNSAVYHQLADRLMALGRLPEAQQVLNLLKAEEYRDFVRRDAAEIAPEKRQAELSAQEAAWQARYDAISGKLVELAKEREGLLAKATLDADGKARLAKLDADYEVGNQGFEKFLDALAAEQMASGSGRKGVSAAELRDTAAMQDTLAELKHGCVAIYTLVGEKSFRAILVTPTVQKGYVVPVSAVELNRRIFAFRQALLDPTMDVKPAAKALYDVLMGPMQADLQQAKATTLMWSLDGALRYVPVAALYDGSKYVVENYRSVIFTPASTTHLKDAPAKAWDAAGFGVSKASENAPALPGVVAELHGIIRDANGTGGPVPGEIKIDDEFTEVSLRAAVATGKYDVLHIASHFRLAPGNDASSFLLLGDGGRLTLTDIGVRLKGLFRGVNLVTLSACDTGVGSVGRDGREVEGFGVMAQRNGAKSVVASLWPVADVSTSRLMTSFYGHLAEHAETKLDALREAQLGLLRGGGAEFAHPYYWAPFFMMGNWL